MQKKEKSLRGKSPLKLTLDTSVTIDLNIEFRWENPLLSDKQKIFVFFRACLDEADLKRSVAFCSRQAGYGSATGYKMLKKQNILNEITNITKQNLERLPKIKIKIKESERKRKKSSSAHVFLEVRKGKVIDINEAFLWNPYIPKMQRKFIFLISCFEEEDLRGNIAKLSRLAGYSQKAANTYEYTLFKDEQFLSEISKIKRQNSYKGEVDIDFLLRPRSPNEKKSIFIKIPKTGEIININQKMTFDKSYSEQQLKFIALCASVQENELKEMASFLAEEAGYTKQGIKVRSRKLLERDDIAFSIQKARKQYFLDKKYNLTSKGGENEERK